MILDQYMADMREQQIGIERALVAQGIPLERIDWTYESEQTAEDMVLRSRPRLKTDDEMVGRCSDSSCCG